MENNVRKLRLNRSMSQRALAKAACVSHTTIVNVEHGYHVPSVQTLAKLASALGCGIADILQVENAA